RTEPPPTGAGRISTPCRSRLRPAMLPFAFPLAWSDLTLPALSFLGQVDIGILAPFSQHVEIELVLTALNAGVVPPESYAHVFGGHLAAVGDQVIPGVRLDGVGPVGPDFRSPGGHDPPGVARVEIDRALGDRDSLGRDDTGDRRLGQRGVDARLSISAPREY